jgi:serine/threonine-protein kinase
MAEIHLARLAGEGGFEKIVVVKRLLPELVASPAYVAMFLDEGKLVSRLDHPNICEVFELGRDGAEYFLAMPYLDGIAVNELISRPRDPDRMPGLRVAAGVIAQACRGLQHAHELCDADSAPAGLVHRDISPSNLFVTTGGIVKVLDFGIAKVRGAAETEVGTIKGKSQYMAPEQLLGESLDRRCDVFALGIVLFELATHQRLFKRASEYLSARAVLEEPVPRADAVDPAVPAALADVIAKALARERDARFATTRELRLAIDQAMEAHGGIAEPDQIADTIKSTEELSAQRTRQARVLGEARSRVLAPPAHQTRPLRPPSRADSDVVTAPRDEIEPTQPYSAKRVAAVMKMQAEVTDQQRAVARTVRRARWLLLACIVIPAAAVLIPVLAFDGCRGAKQATHAGEPTPPAAAIIAPAPRAGSGLAEALPTGSADARSAGSADLIEMPADPARAPRRGFLSIDSTPYATIFVGPTRLGVTPVVKRSLPAGRHKLRAVLADGRTKELSIDIPAGKLAAPIQLTW